MVVEPAQIDVAPKISERLVGAFTVTDVVTGLLVHPLELVYEYVIVVDPDIPILFAVTTPL